MTNAPKLLMLVGAATPPGRLAAAIAVAAGVAQTSGGDVAVEILNLAETPIDICDGRPLDSYSETTRQVVDRPGVARKLDQTLAVMASHAGPDLAAETEASEAATVVAPEMSNPTKPCAPPVSLAILAEKQTSTRPFVPAVTVTAGPAVVRAV